MKKFYETFFRLIGDLLGFFSLAIFFSTVPNIFGIDWLTSFKIGFFQILLLLLIAGLSALIELISKKVSK